MYLTGPVFGLVFGVFIAAPAIRLEGFYYALLTVGIAELCRAYVAQSQPSVRQRPVRRGQLRAELDVRIAAA